MFRFLFFTLFVLTVFNVEAKKLSCLKAIKEITIAPVFKDSEVIVRANEVLQQIYDLQPRNNNKLSSLQSKKLRERLSSQEIWPILESYGVALTQYMSKSISRNSKDLKKNSDKSKKNQREKSLKRDLKRYFRETIPVLKEKNSKVAIIFEGIDSAGKGISIKFLRKVLLELKKEDPVKYGILLKTIKLGKPDQVYSTRDYITRWANELPRSEEAAIVFLDRGPLHNRLVTEKAWKWTERRKIKEFQEQIKAVREIFEKEHGFSVFSVWSNISFGHLLFNLNRRITTERRQHLNSPVDAKAITMWNRYIESEKEGLLTLMRQGEVPTYYVNSSYWFRYGEKSSTSRKVAIAQGVVMGLNRVVEANYGVRVNSEHFARVQNKNSKLVIPVFKKEGSLVLLEVMEHFRWSDFGNHIYQNPKLLGELQVLQNKLRKVVIELLESGHLVIDPNYAVEEKVKLGVE